MKTTRISLAPRSLSTTVTQPLSQFKRRVSALSVAAGLACLSAQALAADTVRLIVPFTAGGPADMIARKLSEKLGPELAATIVVENRPGANGAVGVNAVTRAEGDGSVLLFATSGMLTISPVLYKSLPFDPLRDLKPVASAVVNGSVLLVNAKLPVQDIPSFAAYANSQPNPLPIGSAGQGNITHLYMEMLKANGKMALTHIPYKGVASALADVIGGQIAGVFVDLPAALPQMEGGRVKALGLVGTERSPAAPDIKTIDEQGVKGVDSLSWFGFMGPAALTDEAAQRFYKALQKVLADPALVADLKSIGSVPYLKGPEEMRKLILQDQKRWEEVIRTQKIVVD